MTTTWPTENADEVLSGELVKSHGLVFWDMNQCLQFRGQTLDLGDASSSTISYVAGTSDTYRVPPNARSGMKIRITAKCTRTGGSEAYYRAAETGGPTLGSIQTTTSTTGEWLTSEITIPDNTWAEAEKTFELQAAGDAGGSTSDVTVDLACCFVQVTD